MNMLKKARKLLTVVLSSAILFCTSSTVFADNGTVTNDNQPKVVIGDTDLPVPDSIIQGIIKENPDAVQININECKIDKNESNEYANQRMELTRLGNVYYTDVVKTVTNSSVAKTSFVTSVAKGQTITLGYAWSSSLSCSISGTIDAVSLGITSSISRSYTASQTFSGPPESSSCNSRSYYVKFYQNNGTYTATCHDPFPGWYITYPVDGTYTEPTYYVSYSVDTTVK